MLIKEASLKSLIKRILLEQDTDGNEYDMEKAHPYEPKLSHQLKAMPGYGDGTKLTDRSPIPNQKGKFSNRSSLDTLDKAAKPIKEFLERLVELGYHVYVNSCYRSMGKQKELYDRLSKDPNREADVAPPGGSPHNYGLGVDVTLFFEDEDGNTKKLGLDASNKDWLKHIDNDVVSYHDYKLEWGGNFRKRDAVHFDVYPITVEELGIRTGGYGSESMWERDSFEKKLSKKAAEKGLPIDSLYSDIV